MYLHGLIALALSASAPQLPTGAQVAVAAVAPGDTVPASTAIGRAERWRTPFAVESTGQVAAREPRMAPVRAESAATPRPDSAAAVETGNDAAARPDSAATATKASDDTTSAPSVAAKPKPGAARSAARPMPPKSAPADSTAVPARRTGRTHPIAHGETLYGIAQRYGVTVAALRAANPDVDWDRMRSGMKLRIPDAVVPAGTKPAGADSAAARSGTRKHRVVTGDTLFGIARRYGVSPAAIRAANHLTSDEVRLGATLVIPGK